MPFLTAQTIAQSDLTGMVWWSFARAIASGEWLKCDGSAVSRSTYGGLFAVLCPISAVTVTSASPGVVTWTGHPLVNGDVVVFSASGSVPTGLTAGTLYYVVSASTNTFQVSATKGGTAINTSSTGSGVSVRCVTTGNGDGTTTFNLPDARGRTLVGSGTGTKTVTLPAVAISANAIAINASQDFEQGMPVTYAGSSITGLSAGTYYVIKASAAATTIKLASTQANANSGTAVSISGTPAGDTLAYSLSARNIGDTGGEETHGISQSEDASHTHTVMTDANFSGGANLGTSQTPGGTRTTGSSGGDVQHNNMMPFLSLNCYIHI